MPALATALDAAFSALLALGLGGCTLAAALALVACKGRFTPEDRR